MAANPIPEAVSVTLHQDRAGCEWIIVTSKDHPGSESEVTPSDDPALFDLLKALAAAQQQGGEVIQRHVVTKYRDGSVHVADVTTPPSAPVGVEWTDERIIAVCKAAGVRWIEADEEEGGFPGGFDITHMPEMRRLFTALAQQPAPSAPVGVEAIIAEDDAGWALAKRAEAAGAERDESDDDLWWTLRIEQFKALAQQPAAPTWIGIDWAAGQQPAAVFRNAGSDLRLVLCPDCGNKRCPHANDHRNGCTASNEPGQPGSAYPALATQHQEPTA